MGGYRPFLVVVVWSLVRISWSTDTHPELRVSPGTRLVVVIFHPVGVVVCVVVMGQLSDTLPTDTRGAEKKNQEFLGRSFPLHTRVFPQKPPFPGGVFPVQ
jgi:hypothetical protein